jgi:hypothetical protein
VPSPDHDRLRSVFDRVERHVEDRWNIPVHIADVPNPFTGDLDGEQIIVDYDLDIEDAVFILIHLFGHTVQWNCSKRSREIGLAPPGSQTYTEDLLREIAAYEHEACAYSLQLLHDCGVTDLDGWVSDFAACDCAYLMHLYRTGEKRAFRTFWRDGAALVAPRRIPDFQPTRWISRYDGTVV